MKKYKLFDRFTDRVKLLLPKNRWLRYLYGFSLLVTLLGPVVIATVLVKEIDIIAFLKGNRGFFFTLVIGWVLLGLVYPLVFAELSVKLWNASGHQRIKFDAWLEKVIHIVKFILSYLGHILILCTPIALFGFLFFLLGKMHSIFALLFMLCFILACSFVIILPLNLLLTVDLLSSGSFFARLKLFFQLFNLHKFKLMLIFFGYFILLYVMKVVSVYFLFPFLILMIFVPAFMVTIYENLCTELIDKQKNQPINE